MFQDNTKPGGSGATPEKEENKIDIGSILTLEENIKSLRTNTLGLLDSILKSFQTLDQFTASVSKTFAGANQFASAIRQNIVEATPAVTELGGSMEVVQKMQLEVMKNLSTQTLINADSFAELYSNTSLVSEAGADIGTQTGKVVKSFADAGYGLYSTSKEMLGVINTARELGVQTNAVFKQVQDNMSKLNSFNFTDGIQGMAKMAANAALLRIDMKSTLALADQLFDPEKAIEMAGGFQRMGVQVAELLDPYKLMDMARNDPEQLQENIGKALAQYTEFDGQRTKIMSGALGHIRELSKVTGKSVEELTQWGISYADIGRKMKEIPLSPDFDTNEEDRKMIAGMAQLATSGKFEGQYIVTLQNETGGTETKLVSQLTNQDREMLERAQAPAKTAVELQQQSLSELSKIYNTLQAQRDILALGLITNPKFNMGMRKFFGIYEALAKTQGEILGLKREPVGEKGTEVFRTTGLREGIDKLVDGSIKTFDDAIKKGDFAGAMSRLRDMGGDIGKDVKEKLEKSPEMLKENLETSGYSKEESESIINFISKSLNFVYESAKDAGKKITGSETIQEIENKLKQNKLLIEATEKLGNGFNNLYSDVKTFGDYLKNNMVSPIAGKETTPMSLNDMVMKALTDYKEEIKKQPTSASQSVTSLPSTSQFSVAPITSVSTEIEKIASSKFYGENITKNIEEKKTTVDLNINTNPPTLKQDMLNAIMMDPQLRELLTNTVKQEMMEETKKIGGIPK